MLSLRRRLTALLWKIPEAYVRRVDVKGGISDLKNRPLMKMLYMIGIGERAGSGVPDILFILFGRIRTGLHQR